MHNQLLETNNPTNPQTKRCRIREEHGTVKVGTDWQR